MAKDELDAFRDRWKKEITSRTEEKRDVSSDSCSGRIPELSRQSDSRNSYFGDLQNPSNEQSEASTSSDEHPEDVGCINGEVEADQPEYVSIASSLLDGRTGPLLDRIQRERTLRKRQYHNMTAVCSASLQQQQQQQPQSKVMKDPELLDQLIQDLNEVNNIPFFDSELPYEVALKIFQHLNCIELGRCAQVSRAWRVLAEDRALWFKICVGEGYHQHANMSDSPCWKSALRDCRNSAKTLRFNWKNRVGSISQLQFELGKILCDVSSSDQYVVAGYTSGDVRLWDTLHWDLAASYLKTNSLSANENPRPHVAHVRVNNTVAAAAYEDGCVDLWSTETGGEPLHHYQTAGSVQALALSPDAPILASAAGPQVRLDCADDHGYWRTLCQTQLPNNVESLVLVPDRGQQHPLAAVVAGDAVYLLDHLEEEPRLLHLVYGQPITCLDASNSHVAFGVKRTGWAMHDGGNKIHIYNLETGKSVMCVGGVPGVFTCISLRDSAPHLLLCGNKDRRVSMFDLRTGTSVGSRDAHHLGVTAVQGDDWKVVSGGKEGLVCVWELRMDAILWEMHNRHPVRHLRFNTSTLVTANIPDDKSPRGACITDDDLTAHRRHRGVICRYDFSEDSSSQDHILPICRSNYTESYGYNYNIRLTVPYDRLAGSHPSH